MSERQHAAEAEKAQAAERSIDEMQKDLAFTASTNSKSMLLYHSC